MPQTSGVAKSRTTGDSISTRWAIEMFDIPKRERTKIPVRAKTSGGELVTLEMVASDVRFMNEVCGLDGKTMQRLDKRLLVFTAVTLQ